jgi:hypothetical protein
MRPGTSHLIGWLEACVLTAGQVANRCACPLERGLPALAEPEVG